MKNLSYLFLLMFSIAIISCGPEKKGEDAEVSKAKAVEQTTASTTYEITKEDSKVGWVGSKPTGRHKGFIPILEGSIAVDGDKIVGGTITLDIKNIQNEDLTDSPDMQNKLITHLKSPDFFHADSFPTVQFVITSVTPYSDQDKPEGKEQFESEYTPAKADEFIVSSPTHKITGNLTMRGKTLSVAFPAQVNMDNGKIMAQAKFNIDRTNWGLMYRDEADVVNKAKDKFIYNTVNVSLEINADKKDLNM